MSAAACHEIARTASAMSFIPAGERALWLRIGMALKAGLGEAGFTFFDRWRQTADSYDAQAVRSVWRKTIRPPRAAIKRRVIQWRLHSMPTIYAQSPSRFM